MKLCETCVFKNKTEYEKPCIVYRENCEMYKPAEKADSNPYKLEQIEKHIEASDNEERYCAQLTGVAGKPINLDRNALVLLERYYSGEDIRGRLMERGYRGTQDEVDAVLNTGYLKNLGDCTDGDWQVIDDAIDQAALSNEESREDY